MTTARWPRALLALVFCTAIGAPSTAASLELHECRLQSEIVSGGAAARCGEYAIREDRDDPQSKRIAVHVAVIPALRLQPEADPLWILSGGPGQAASDFYLSIAPAFSRIRRDRDIVLVDQRGTGRSNRLDCVLPQDTQIAALDAQALKIATQRCVSSLPGDPRFYTTSVAVRDLDEVRAALGYETINLYGASYGTRVAQHYMRRYPQHVRAVILDGIVPPDTPLGPDIPHAVQRALDATFERCAAAALCAQRFPELAETFHQLRSRLENTPAHISLADPRTGEATTTRLGVAELSAAVRLLSYSDETSSILPLLIHEAQIEERPQALAAQYLMVQRTMEEQLAQGMHFSVVCSEDAPRWSASDDAAIARTFMGPAFMAAMRTICAEWPRGPVDEDFFTPLETSTPTLMLSGGADPATPASYAQQILPGFAHAKHLVQNGQGHGQIGIGCMPRVAAAFIERASLDALDVECLQNISPTPFMLSLTGAAP